MDLNLDLDVWVGCLVQILIPVTYYLYSLGICPKLFLGGFLGALSCLGVF